MYFLELTVLLCGRNLGGCVGEDEEGVVYDRIKLLFVPYYLVRSEVNSDYDSEYLRNNVRVSCDVSSHFPQRVSIWPKCKQI